MSAELMQAALSLGEASLQPIRRHLAHGAWLDVQSGLVADDPDLFDALLDSVPWHKTRRQMYDREVDVPRLTAWCTQPRAIPHPGVVAAFEQLDQRYFAETGEHFATAGLCLYRDGSDSVAWHGDTIGRGSTQDTVVAIISLGAPRKLALRPRGGGLSFSVSAGHGDLVVMGGSCQRTWEHAVPKTAAHCGPRISIQFRPAGVA